MCVRVVVTPSSTFKKTFFDVGSFDDLWSYIEGPLFNGLYPDHWYNGDAFSRTEALQRFERSPVHRGRGGSGAVARAHKGTPFSPNASSPPLSASRVNFARWVALVVLNSLSPAVLCLPRCAVLVS